jgi:spermidine synthase
MMPFAWWLSLGVGFLSLSQEILWVRLVSFAFEGPPQAFSLVLALFLIGIALGAYVGKWFCARSHDLYAAGALTLIAAALVDLLLPHTVHFFLGRDRPGLPWLPLAIVGTAALKSVLFPIAHHLGSNQSGPQVGSSVSRVYFGNILGSTLGPIVTGFVLLDLFTVEQCMTIVGLGCALLGALMALRSGARRAKSAAISIAATAAAAAAAAPTAEAIPSLAVRTGDEASRITNVVQNKHGIIHTASETGQADVVFGGNLYDGRITIDMVSDPNGLARAYVLAAFHPAPRRVLVVGMSGGAWTRAVAGFPGVQRIDVVEINPAYLTLVGRYPEVAPILTDQRIQIHIDDGRRWLKRHPEAMYDLIVQNTTFHWRSNTANLLSAEFFREVQQHMRPGAIVAINTTRSLDVYRTAQEVFPFTARFHSFVYGADRDFRVPAAEALERLARCRVGDRAAFEPEQFEPGGLAYHIANDSIVPVADFLAGQSTAGIGVVTDQNLLTEYRHGSRDFLPALQRLLAPKPGSGR